MTNYNSTSNFIFSASEHELLTLSLAEIVDGLMADYHSFSRGNEAGIRIPDSKQEPRMSHSCILYAEGLRLAHSHPELAVKLILASLFDFVIQANYWLKQEEKAKKDGKQFDVLEEISKFNHYTTRAFTWLKENGGTEKLQNLLREIKAFEDFKTVERKKAAEEEMRRKGLIK